MRYYVDFDRTIFDTDAFIIAMAERLQVPASELPAVLKEGLTSGTLTFADLELRPYVYPDALAFLREKENAATIITFGNRVVQEAKIKSALSGIPRLSIMYTESLHKADYLAPHTHLHQGAVLVDDRWEELEKLSKMCAPLELREMRRDERRGDGRWQVITSLAELA